MSFNPIRWQLKSKFVSIILLVLLIPISSVFLLKEIEKSLVENLKQNLLLTSKLYGLQLSRDAVWFNESNLPTNQEYLASELFVFPLQETVVLDGFFEEWLFIEKFRQEFFTLNDLQKKESMGVILGTVNQQLYISIKIKDESVVYANLEPKPTADFLVINFVNQDNVRERLFIYANAPGRIAVKKYVNGDLRIDWRYVAHWVETEHGFNLEVKFPVSIKPRQLQVIFYDKDIAREDSKDKVISTDAFEINPLVWPSQQLTDYIQQLNVIAGQRVWILDNFGRVLGRQGSLNNRNANDYQSGLINWLLASNNDKVVDFRGDRLRLDSAVIFEALREHSSTDIETSLDGDYSIAIAASPIIIEGEAVGAVLIEENVARVQLLQKQTLSQMLYVMFAIILFVVILIGWYVSRLVSRIGRLKLSINQVVDDEGRMLSPVEFDEESGDEIASLNNAFSKMSNKLYEYNNYLEKLASRLSHELRTPIAIVRSSLDNLSLGKQDNESLQTIQHAINGTQRLSEIITRMRESSGVKQAMQTATFESIDLDVFLRQIVAGFNASFADFNFLFESEGQVNIRKISPELLAELMDKLLANAMDFSKENGTISIALIKDNKHLTISVSNYGEIIEKKNLKKIFQSLISIRREEQVNHSAPPNLGLGLYVVKLIAEFHGASVKAENIADDLGVKFSMTWKNSTKADN